ncbi:unnamed protein product, partial [Onchocerca ochengi]|uniref:HMG box domain-containing protein n=1 Tax=Onchocerca ochengi TaxID=42157 RepID=A0A182EMP5_ONCOC
MSIYNAFLVFTECMHLSLEKKLARNFNTLDEVIYYTMPYWNKLSNDEKKGWIRRAEAEKSIRRDIQVGKYRDKIKLIMKQFDNGAEFGLNSREIQHARIQERKIDDRKIANINQPFSNLSKKRSNSTSGETEKQFLKKKSVSFVLPQQSIRRQKDQNALIRDLSMSSEADVSSLASSIELKDTLIDTEWFRPDEIHSMIPTGNKWSRREKKAKIIKFQNSIISHRPFYTRWYEAYKVRKLHKRL